MKNLPEKIYVHETSALELDVKIPYSVEYIRKDTFIKKACEYLMEYEFNDSLTIADRRKRIENFKKYMEG